MESCQVQSFSAKFPINESRHALITARRSLLNSRALATFWFHSTHNRVTISPLAELLGDAFYCVCRSENISIKKIVSSFVSRLLRVSNFLSELLAFTSKLKTIKKYIHINLRGSSRLLMNLWHRYIFISLMSVKLWWIHVLRSVIWRKTVVCSRGRQKVHKSFIEFIATLRNLLEVTLWSHEVQIAIIFWCSVNFFLLLFACSNVLYCLEICQNSTQFNQF